MEPWGTVGLLGCACVAALVALRALKRRDAGAGAMRVVARLALEPRRSLVLVQVGARCFLVGVGDGPMTTLAELQPGDLPDAVTKKQTDLFVSEKKTDQSVFFGSVWARAWRRVIGGRA